MHPYAMLIVKQDSKLGRRQTQSPELFIQKPIMHLAFVIDLLTLNFIHQLLLRLFYNIFLYIFEKKLQNLY